MRIILGVTGGIAAYKTPELVRLLIKHGHEVQVVMTDSAKHFVTQMTLQAVSNRPVCTTLLDTDFENAMGHINLARWAELILIAPATANTIATLRFGMANDLLTTICLATTAPIKVAPAMNHKMWENPQTQENIQALKNRQVEILGPDYGQAACMEIGFGRMLEPVAILDSISSMSDVNLLKDLKILITAGPTFEPIDPVRYIGNRSSGKMGTAIANWALKMGANVTLIHGPISETLLNNLKDSNIKLNSVTTAEQMYQSVLDNISQNNPDIFISVAAVADFKVKDVSSIKIKKTESLNLQLIKNPDILATVANLNPEVRPKFCVGFAAETDNGLVNAKDKLFTKNLDIIALNKVGDNIGFASNQNQLNVLAKNIQNNNEIISTKLPYQDKQSLAKQLLTIISERFYAKFANSSVKSSG